MMIFLSKDAASPTVCRVNRAVYQHQLIVTWWITLADVSCRPNFPMLPPNPIESYSNVLSSRLTEVLEVRSSLGTIHVDAVKDIAFVFHINILEHEYPNCAGMSRVFYTQYQYNTRDRLVAVDCQVHFPFSCIVLDSYPS